MVCSGCGHQLFSSSRIRDSRPFPRLADGFAFRVDCSAPHNAELLSQPAHVSSLSLSNHTHTNTCLLRIWCFCQSSDLDGGRPHADRSSEELGQRAAGPGGRGEREEHDHFASAEQGGQGVWGLGLVEAEEYSVSHSGGEVPVHVMIQNEQLLMGLGGGRGTFRDPSVRRSIRFMVLTRFYPVCIGAYVPQY